MQESGPGEKQELFLIDFSISSHASAEFVGGLGMFCSVYG